MDGDKYYFSYIAKNIVSRPIQTYYLTVDSCTLRDPITQMCKQCQDGKALVTQNNTCIEIENLPTGIGIVPNTGGLTSL